MSQLRTVKHPDYHKAVSEVLENQVMPHLPSNVSVLLVDIYLIGYFSEVMKSLLYSSFVSGRLQMIFLNFCMETSF